MFRKLVFVLAAIASTFATTSLAQADVVFGSSSSMILSSTLYSDIHGNVNLGFGLLSDSAPPAYSDSYGPQLVGGGGSVYSFSADAGSGAISSNVDGTAGSKSASGSVTLDDFSFTMLDIIAITGDMSTSVSAFGDFGDMNGSTSTSINEGTLTVLGSSVSLGFDEIYNQDGLRIVMHDSGISTGDDFAESFASLFLIEFTNFAHDGDVFNGSITIAPATSNLRAVPEPGTLLVLGGLGLAAAVRRRRR